MSKDLAPRRELLRAQIFRPLVESGGTYSGSTPCDLPTAAARRLPRRRPQERVGLSESFAHGSGSRVIESQDKVPGILGNHITWSR